MLQIDKFYLIFTIHLLLDSISRVCYIFVGILLIKFIADILQNFFNLQNYDTKDLYILQRMVRQY